MKTRLFSALVSLICAVALKAELPADPEVTEKLVGEWIVPQDQYTSVMRGGGLHFNKNGTFTSYGILKMKDQEIRIEVEGKWKVEKGILIEEITKSSHAQIVSVGSITRDTLLQLTNKEYRYRTEKGQEAYRVRKK